MYFNVQTNARKVVFVKKGRVFVYSNLGRKMGTVRLEMGFVERKAAVRLKTGFKNDGEGFRGMEMNVVKNEYKRFLFYFLFLFLFYSLSQSKNKCSHKGTVLAPGATNSSYTTARKELFNFKFDIPNGSPLIRFMLANRQTKDVLNCPFTKYKTP